MLDSLRKVLYHILNRPQKKNNVTFFGFHRGLQNVAFEGKNAIPDRCNFSGTIKIGYATTLGYNNLLGGTITIGKYCQIGADVAMHATNHPMNYMTTYINKNLFQGELKKLKEDKQIHIGHDVWIGHNVIIVGNVNVGNGAILAAGSVVTKDVPPYTIVAGVPAKPIRKRFSDKVVQEIEALHWWDKSEAELEKIKPLFFKDFTNKESIYE
ncbi:MAG TPA: CatB-related O-acetyltransferase [Flavobacterium sp.]|uniref:CatB-related O-acetyltransferase n=1 Tax=Flavobacterium sp. TaxID=239 RepID=UPI002D120D18|nr:CatB-related O-acetyltransferase [Flavobacterium sp.]HSD13287.1 CatB-related O-acetyltransferase [Flavobacterium sp.]